jgi:hypothetical protein
MSDWFLEQRINIKFCVTSGRNASDTCAMLSEAYGGEAVKKLSLSVWHKRLKKGSQKRGRWKKWSSKTSQNR